MKIHKSLCNPKITDMRYLLFIVLVTLLAICSCSKEKKEPIEPSPPITATNGPCMLSTVNIWKCGPLAFAKIAGTDPSDPLNQDRITDSVWITRGANGQIYNAALENAAVREVSPLGTLWAEGSIDDISSLTFKPFRDAVVRPQSVPGKNLVLFLEKDSIYLSLQFSNWESGGSGGFTYSRSTQN